MLNSTYDAVKAILKADPSITVPERNELLSALRNGPTKRSPADAPPSEPRLLRRAEAARRAACSVRLIDRLAKDGVLPKRRLPGRQRAAGVLESDLLALLTAGPPAPATRAKAEAREAA